MRRLFLFATGLFWIAVLVVAAGRFTAPDDAAAGTATPVARAPAVDARFTLDDVARHATEADCWMAIDGVVYDLTAYLPEHPSRPAIILPWCGKEASQAYRTKTRGRPHSSEADDLLPRYRIGVLAGA